MKNTLKMNKWMKEKNKWIKKINKWMKKNEKILRIETVVYIFFLDKNS